jgi:hypothetical protein
MLDKAVNMAVTTCKCILLTAILAFDFLLLKYVPWVTEVLIRMKYYVAMLLILSAVVTFVPFRIAKLKTSLHKNELLAVGALFCIPFLYLTITAYSQTVYKLIPTNRGGSYSVVQACVRLDEKIGKRFSAIMDRKSNNTTIPVFVIEETADTLYLVRPYSLFSKVERDVYAIGKHNVRGIDFSANSYRHPTVNPISR